ncbi:MAG: hypothetical protein JSV38_08835, partial [Desulfobacterales bacterium]
PLVLSYLNFSLWHLFEEQLLLELHGDFFSKQMQAELLSQSESLPSMSPSQSSSGSLLQLSSVADDSPQS